VDEHHFAIDPSYPSSFHQHEHVALLLLTQISAFVHQLGDARGRWSLRNGLFGHAVKSLHSRRKIGFCFQLLVHQTLEMVYYFLLLVDLRQF
jgi:hypothetical protein